MKEMGLLSVKVMKKAVEAEDVCSFELVRADGGALVPFSAGAHIDVHIADGLVRQYSLCNDPTEQHRYLIATLRDAKSRGGSIAMHENVQVGDVLRISEPRNQFQLIPAKHYLLLAGGIGITPILCMAEKLSQTLAEFELHYCTRSSERTAFKSRIEESSFADRAHFHYDSGSEQQKLDLKGLLASQTRGTHLFVCGPTGFISHVVDTAKGSGWPEAEIHLEHFGAGAINTSGDSGFDIRIASSGKTYFVPPEKRVIDVLSEEGIEIPVSCEAGVCGTCLTRVLEGIPEHRDCYLSVDEHARNDQFTPCCSRAKTALLVLDL